MLQEIGREIFFRDEGLKVLVNSNVCLEAGYAAHRHAGCHDERAGGDEIGCRGLKALLGYVFLGAAYVSVCEVFHGGPRYRAAPVFGDIAVGSSAADNSREVIA